MIDIFTGCEGCVDFQQSTCPTVDRFVLAQSSIDERLHTAATTMSEAASAIDQTTADISANRGNGHPITTEQRLATGANALRIKRYELVNANEGSVPIAVRELVAATAAVVLCPNSVNVAALAE